MPAPERPMRVPIVRAAILVALALIAAAACSSYTDARLTADPTATKVLLTDAPFPYDRLARVDLYVVSVSGSLSPDTSASSGTFVTLATPNRRIDVLALQGGVTEQLGALKLAAGVITAMRMVIDTDSSTITLKDGRVLTSTSTPGIQWQSSAGRPVLNGLIHEQILVPDSGGVAVIDFDVGRSFIPPQEINPLSTDSGFVFSPVLRAADARRTGTITGVVRAGTSGGAVVANASVRLWLGSATAPANTQPMLSTARTDASGRFKFPYVTRSAYWVGRPFPANYWVTADPPSAVVRGQGVVASVPVTAGVETDVGTVVLP